MHAHTPRERTGSQSGGRAGELSRKSTSIIGRDVLLGILRFGIGVFVARILGPIGFGSWAMLELITNYLRVFGAPRFEIACVNFLGRRRYDRGEVMFLTNLIAVVMGLVWLGAVFVARDRLQAILFRQFEVSTPLIVATACYLPLLFVVRNYMYFLLSLEDIASFNALQIIQDVTRNALTVLLLLILTDKLWALPISAVTSGALATLYGAVKVHRVQRMGREASWRLAREMLGFSATVYVGEAVGFLNLYASNLLTGLYLPPSAMAFLSVGKGKAELLNQISTAVSTVLYPVISNRERKPVDAEAVTTRAFRLCLIVLSGFGLLGIALAYPLIVTLYGWRFAPAATAFCIVIPGVVIQGAANVQRQYFVAMGRPDLPLKIAVPPLALQAIACVVLIPRLGFGGAALAASVALIVSGILYVAAYRQFAGTSYREMLVPKREDFVWIGHRAKELFGSFRCTCGRPIAWWQDA